MISICIPVRNAGDEFRTHLERWREQDRTEPFEVVACDSSSEDNSVQIAEAAGARVFSISPEEFNHGETRNRLAGFARGDILVFTVQDAYPAHRRTLVELTESLREDREVAGVTGSQIPRPDANLIARWETEHHSFTYDKGFRKKRMPPAEEFCQFDLMERFDVISFDNVLAAMRREWWERFPFSSMPFAEDLDWSLRVMRAGAVIVHNPRAQVYHSHNRSPWVRSKRYFVTRLVLNGLLDNPEWNFSWQEKKAFEALRDFRLEVMRLRDELRGQTTRVHRLALPRSYLYLALRALEKWGGSFGQSLGKRWQPHFPLEFLRRYFNYVCSLVTRCFGRLSGADALFVTEHVEAQVVGDFLGHCLFRWEQEAPLSPELAALKLLYSRYY